VTRAIEVTGTVARMSAADCRLAQKEPVERDTAAEHMVANPTFMETS
jgi:hypothetical protein